MTTPDGSQRQQRRSIRLQGYDYTQEGAYFLTVCAHNRACLFGDVIAGEMRLNDAGRLVQTAWEGLPNHYPRIELDAWVIMPNHVHGIVWIAGSGPVRAASVGAGLKPAPTTVAATKRYGLSEIVRGFKTFSARRVNAMRGTPGTPVWQRNYYEHVIRDEAALDRIRGYLAENPARWDEDLENPARRPR